MSRRSIYNLFTPIWVQAPMLRLLAPFIGGILLQWNGQFSLQLLILFTGVFTLLLPVFSLISFLKKYLGLCLQFVLCGMGSLVVWLQDTSHHPAFIGNTYTDSSCIVATLQEPLQEKNKSYKAEASVQIFSNNRLQNCKGNLIIYLQKDSLAGLPPLGYGSQIVFKKTLQPIANAGNPGGFNYQQYCAFHGVYYQVFIKQNEYAIQPYKVINPFRAMLFGLQKWVLQKFQKLISGSKEAGVAEALLIGYRNDLDIELVQQYSNTGVVHIIAISGMHLGLIYGLLLLFFKPFGKHKKLMLLRAIIIISMLWTFSLLTGAAPSIVRSAIMFTFIVLGQATQQKPSIYNNLAASAFLILLFDPFSLWDVGFQLSYTAVLSIAIFATPINNWFYFKSKWKRRFWQLNAVTLAAQIVTYPIVAYHFHQFPNLFLLTNLVAVPLSSGILYALLLLLAVSWIPIVAPLLGKFASALVWLMNSFIELINKLPFALTDGIYFTLPQAIALFAIIAACSWWLMYKSSPAFVVTLFCFTLFLGLRTRQAIQNDAQQKLIVYNVPQKMALDIVRGTNYIFLGDVALKQAGFLSNFHLKPSRVLHQMKEVAKIPDVGIGENGMVVGDKKIIFLKGNVDTTTQIIKTDLLIITHNPKLKLQQVIKCISPEMIVADATNSRWKIAQWQKDAATLHLRFHAVATQGAYTLNW